MGCVKPSHRTPSSSCLSPSPGTVAKIMSLGGFKIRYMIFNGKTRPEILELYGGSVLGLPWDTSEDMIRLSMDVNLSPKKEGIRTGESRDPETKIRSSMP